MQAQNPFRSVLMGNGTLLVQCAEALLARADEALYVAKSDGGGAVRLAPAR